MGVVFISGQCAPSFLARPSQKRTAPAKVGKAKAREAGEGLLERAMKGRARIIDLTQPLSSRTPAYGGEKDLFRYEKLADFDREGYAAGAIRVPEHFGTHVDAPGHFIKGRETVDRLDARRLIAPAVVIDVRSKVATDSDYRLSPSDIQAWERGGAIPEGSAVLLLTGWDRRYGDPEKYRNADSNKAMHFPGFSDAAIGYLLRERKIVALGIDTLSIDYGMSADFSGHRLSHASGLYHIENLAHLDELPARGSVIFVGPLLIQGGSGSPARVLAVAP
jgi:kynurenine formamidase